MESSQPTLEQVTTAVRQLAASSSVDLRAALLFGSHAAGTATPNSDFDILLVLPDDLNVHELFPLECQFGWKLSTALRWPVDVVATTETALLNPTEPVVASALRTGRVLLGQLPYANEYARQIG